MYEYWPEASVQRKTCIYGLHDDDAILLVVSVTMFHAHPYIFSSQNGGLTWQVVVSSLLSQLPTAIHPQYEISCTFQL